MTLLRLEKLLQLLWTSARQGQASVKFRPFSLLRSWNVKWNGSSAAPLQLLCSAALRPPLPTLKGYTMARCLLPSGHSPTICAMTIILHLCLQEDSHRTWEKTNMPAPISSTAHMPTSASRCLDFGVPCAAVFSKTPSWATQNESPTTACFSHFLTNVPWKKEWVGDEERTWKSSLQSGLKPTRFYLQRCAGRQIKAVSLRDMCHALK